eukprot:scaffold111422_cov53-Attheya_sp.AAC.1
MVVHHYVDGIYCRLVFCLIYFSSNFRTAGARSAAAGARNLKYWYLGRLASKYDVEVSRAES